MLITKVIMFYQLTLFGINLPEQSKPMDDMASCQSALAHEVGGDLVKAVTDAGGHVRSAGCKTVTYTYRLSKQR